jgi:phthiocerol/phenolphthiocerol synthesis type-I polyketide synthase C
MTDSPPRLPSESSIIDWLVEWVAADANIDQAQIDTSEPFAVYGLGSVEAVSLVAYLEERLGVALPATLAWDFPTIEALAAHLSACVGTRTATERA